MARIRTIVPEFWEDERSADVSLPALLLYIGMKNFATDDGVITDNPLILRSKVFPAREDIRRQQVSLWLQELIENSFLVPLTFEGKGYYVLDFSSERIDKPKRSHIPQEVIDAALMNAESHVPRTLQDDDDDDNDSQTVDSRQVEKIPEQSGTVGNVRDKSRIVAKIPAGEERRGKDIGEEGGNNAHTREAPALRQEESADFKKFRKWIEENAPNVGKLREPFTEAQFERIRVEFPPDVITGTLLSMHNYRELLKRYVSANLTFRKWAKKDMANETTATASRAPTKREANAEVLRGLAESYRAEWTGGGMEGAVEKPY